MKKHKKNLIIILLSALVCAGLFWHIQTWQDSGRYADMNEFIGTSKVALTVLYDIGVMLLFAGALGLFFSKIIDTITKK
jgi:hypothetical protein